MNDRHFANFYLAGFSYYDGIDVLEQLNIGVPLTLKAEPENPFDHNAVAIFFQGTHLGYVPKDENGLLSKFLRLGHTDLFEAKICQVSRDAFPEKQIRVMVRIVAKGAVGSQLTTQEQIVPK